MSDVTPSRDVEPVTSRVHDNSWSVSLEQSQHSDNPDLVVAQAAAAIEHTTAGNHVNLVTHGDLGHPETYLYGPLTQRFEAIELSYVEQCGCGGHVVRAHVEP